MSLSSQNGRVHAVERNSKYTKNIAFIRSHALTGNILDFL